MHLLNRVPVISRRITSLVKAEEMEKMKGRSFVNTLTRRHMLSLGVASGASLTLASCETTSGGSPQTKTAPLSSKPASPLKLQIVIFDGFEITDALAPFDMLTLASNILGSRIDASLVTVNGATEVVSLKGVSVKPTSRFDPSADLLLIPGCGTQWQTLHPQGLSETLQGWHSAGKTIISVCTGAMLVAQSELLKGRNATTHHTALDAFSGLKLLP